MADLTLQIGQDEKHTIHISVSAWTGDTKVFVDGQPVSGGVTLGKRVVRLSVGQKERHEVEVRVGGILSPKIEVWVDGKLSSVG